MKFVYLKTFLTLAETKSFIGSAKKLNMTQPGVSQHLHALEKEYQVNLIQRKGRLFHLTESGLRLKNYAEKLFSEHEELKNNIQKDDPLVGICRIASTGGFGHLLYSFLINLNKTNRDLAFHCTVAPNTSIYQGIINNIYDVGFTSTKSEDPLIKASQIINNSYELVLPKKYKNIHSLSELKKIGFIAHPDGYSYAQKLLSENYPKEFHSLDDFPFKGFINQANRILDPVAEGLGFSVLSKFSVQAYPRQKDIHVMDLPKKIIEPIYLVVKKGIALPQRYHFIITELKKYLENLAA